jgi:methylated-DNA-[protein]-cysteine S-methyltransferase
MTDHLEPPTFDPDAAAAAARRFSERAAGEADVAYAVIDSPIGALVAASTPRGLARLAYEDYNGGVDEVLDSLAAKLSPRIVLAPKRLDAVRRELDEYFEGRRTTFDLDVDWTLFTPFGERILRATADIPFGEIATYGEVATRAGNPKASRAAGRALGANPIPIVIPCHRVIGTSGKLVGYTGGLYRKEHLLGLEGVLLG